MPTGAPMVCRTCGGEIAESKGSRYCKNGCQIYTAAPVGSQYMTPHQIEADSNGKVWESGGAAGNLRRLPTCRD